MRLKDYYDRLDDWRINATLGAVSTAVAFGGGVLEAFPGWVTAGQGVVGGAFLMLAALQAAILNFKYVNEVDLDGDL